MLEIAFEDRPPEAVVRISGTVTADELHEAVQMNAREHTLPTDAVVLIEYLDESAYGPEASGVLLFLLDDLLVQDLRAVLVVAPSRLDTEASPARRIRERAEKDDRVHFFDTRAAADAFVEGLRAPSDHPRRAE